LWHAGRAQEAIGHYEEALRLQPDDSEAHYNLGVALEQGGKLDDAVGHFEQALRFKPDAETHMNLGVVLWRTGRVQEAIEHFEQALRLKPDYAPAHNNLGVALLHAGRAQEAIEHFEKVLRVEPDFAETRINLGDALYQLGKVSEAIAQYRETLRLRPDWPPALYKLAWILATDRNANLRNAGVAISLAERLCAVTDYQQADAWDVLAAAYAEAGRFGDAVQTAQKARELAAAAGRQELAQQIQERLKLYQAGQPFHGG
jgi:tetratricopeptide (TPR) repeat protein